MWHAVSLVKVTSMHDHRYHQTSLCRARYKTEGRKEKAETIKREWLGITQFVIVHTCTPDQMAWYVGRNFCGYLILRFFPNRKNSQNIVPANNSNNKVPARVRGQIASDHCRSDLITGHTHTGPGRGTPFLNLPEKARLLLSQVVDRVRVGRIEVSPPLAAAFIYTATGGSISGLLRKRATASPFTRASCYSWSSNGHTSTTVWQKIRSVPHFLQPPAIDKEPESNAKMYVNQRRDEMARTWKYIIYIATRSFPREIPVRGRFFFERRFQPLSVGGFFFQTNGNRSVGAPRAHFRQKLKIDK